MSALFRYLRNRRERDYKPNENSSQAYKLLTTISIIGVFIAVGILVLAFTDTIKLNRYIVAVVSIIAIISIACLLLLPWIKNVGKGEFKKISIVFSSLIVICAVLWIIAVCVLVHLYSKEASAQESYSALIYLKVTLIISIQFLISSFIAGTIIKFRNSMLIFQVITYVSNLYFNFYITYLLVCLKFTPDGLEIAKNIKILGNKLVITLFVLSIVYMIISNAIMKRIEARKVVNVVEDTYNADGTKKVVAETEEISNENENKEETAEDKLAKLKSMYEKELITKEEYEAKKSKILEDM